MPEDVRREKFERLKLLLSETGLHFFADSDKLICLLRFGDLDNTDFDTIFVTLQGGDSDIIVATLTILDGEKGYVYTPEVWKECMRFNKHVGLLKAQYDERYNDIDVSYETWLATLPENLALGIRMLAAEGNQLAKRLKALLAK